MSNSALANLQCEHEDEKWCIIGADSDGDHKLVVSNATRGGLDLVKQWYEEACEERAELFSTINLQSFRMNVRNTAKKLFDGSHNPANGLNPPRTTDHNNATHEQDEDGDDVPALPNDAAKSAKEVNNQFVCETILLYDGEGNEAPFNYVQAQFSISSMTSSRSGDIRSTEKCHIIIHNPSGWKISDQNASSFCTLSANGSQLILKFKLPPAVFNKEILWDMIADFGENKPYKNMATGMLHPAVMAIMSAADMGQSNLPDVIMKIKLSAKCQSVCVIEGLYDGRGATAKLEKAPIPAVRRSSSNAVVLGIPLIHD
jgi:hypothetical protein